MDNDKNLEEDEEVEEISEEDAGVTDPYVSQFNRIEKARKDNEAVLIEQVRKLI